VKIFDLNQLCSEYAKAVNAGDLDAVCSLYTGDAVFVPGTGAEGLSGIAAIRDVLAGFLASKPTMEFEHVYLFQSGDTALARGQWKLTSTGPDGAASVITGSSIEVLRRQSDGSWLYAIDHPWGGDPR
jgi:uncharacterized protein (TIGR02246 family)